MGQSKEYRRALFQSIEESAKPPWLALVIIKETVMSKNVVKQKAKKQKREKSEKKAKQKKIIIAVVCVAVAVAAVVLGFVINHVNQPKIPETYSYHGQTVQLFSDGNFTATLAHNVRKNGTYTKTTEEGMTGVLFNVNGFIETGWIINNELHIPREWDDGHGHGNVFPRMN